MPVKHTCVPVEAGCVVLTDAGLSAAGVLVVTMHPAGSPARPFSLAIQPADVDYLLQAITALRGAMAAAKANAN